MNTTLNTQPASSEQLVQPDSQSYPLHLAVQEALKVYFANMGKDALPTNLYAIILAQIEVPLLQTTLEHTSGNRSLASKMLGISRNTLRKKIQHYNLDCNDDNR